MSAFPDLPIYLVHTAFWGAFGATQLFLRLRDPARTAVSEAPATEIETIAPHSRALLILHSVGFGAMYFGIGQGVFGNRVPAWFSGQRIVGSVVMMIGAAMMSWALIWFRSWRFRAKLDAGHQLATGGPFRWVRHPIYLGLDLLALGTAIWIPSPACWVGLVLMVLGSDLRGRAEERLLTDAFGSAYSTYAARTARFLPGIY